MKVRVGLGGLLVAVLACGELVAPTARTLALSIVPVFDRYAELGSNIDQVRIRIYRISPGPPRDSTQVKDTTVAVDTAGNVNANISVVLLQSPQTFRVRLDGVQSATGAVLFSGSQEVSVTSGASGTPSQATPVPVWVGPVATRIVIAPHDTALAAGGSFSLRATAFNAQGSVITAETRFYLVNSADATKLTLNRTTGRVTAATGQQGEVRVYVETLDATPPRDTARIFVGAVPNSVRITPGYASVGAAQTQQLAAAVLDPIGNTLNVGSVTWASRSPSVATVDASGLVTGVAPGGAVIVATFASFADSIRVIVPPTGNVVVTALGNGRSFRAPAVGDTVQVDVAADLRFTPDAKLGSYNARLTWNTAQLVFVDTAQTQNGDFTSPVVNRDSVGAGVLRFAQANPAGASGVVTVARFRFRAAAAGAGALSLAITEMSAPSPAFTNLVARVTVYAGTVTVR